MAIDPLNEKILFTKEIPDGPTRITKREFFIERAGQIKPERHELIQIERRHFKPDALGKDVWLKSDTLIELAKGGDTMGVVCLIYDLAAEVIRLTERVEDLEERERG